MDFYEKLSSGYYSIAAPWPARPTRPKLLDKRAMDLTKDEILSIGDVLRIHDEEMARYHDARAAHCQAISSLHAEFRRDLAASHDMTGHPKESRLYEIASDRRSGEGFSAITEEYEALLELVK